MKKKTIFIICACFLLVVGLVTAKRITPQTLLLNGLFGEDFVSNNVWNVHTENSMKKVLYTNISDSDYAPSNWTVEGGNHWIITGETI